MRKVLDELKHDFFKGLVEDVILARDRNAADDSQAAKRNLVRSTVSAIEGVLWHARLVVLSYLEDLSEPTDIERMALRETSYVVRENGIIVEQPRHVPTTSMVRLIIALYERMLDIEPIDFSGSDWKNFQDYVALRNRVTHPKDAQDIRLSQTDVEVAQAALFWILELSIRFPEKANAALRDQLEIYDAFLQDLKNHDSAALKLYKETLEEGRL